MADEQVGNSSWMTMTPGSAVAGQLQNILTQKRLEARQSMLDELNARNMQSEMDYRAQNSKSLEANRAALESDRRAQEVQRRAGLYTPDTPMDPNSEDYKFFQKEAPSLINPATPSTPQFDYEGQPDLPGQGPTFRGLPAQIETARKSKLQTDAQAGLEAIANDPTFSKLPIEQQLLKVSKLYPGTDPTAVLERLLTAKNQQTPGHFKVYDEASGKVKDMGELGPNDKTSLIPRPPKENAPRALAPFEGVNAAGESVPLSFNPNTGGFEQAKMPAGLRVVSKIGAKPPVPASLYDDKAKKDLFSAMKNNGPNRGSLIQSAVTDFISKIPDKAVMSDINDIRASATMKNLPVNVLVSKGLLTGTPEHIAKVKTILDIIRGGEPVQK